MLERVVINGGRHQADQWIKKKLRIRRGTALYTLAIHHRVPFLFYTRTRLYKKKKNEFFFLCNFNSKAVIW